MPLWFDYPFELDAFEIFSMGPGHSATFKPLTVIHGLNHIGLSLSSARLSSKSRH